MRQASITHDLKSIPNLVSLARIGVLIVAVLAWFSGFKGLGLALGIIAGLTDYLDGYLARRLNQVTYLGAILDQFSDLLFEASLLLMLMTSDAAYVRPVWLLVVYLVREFWVSTIRRFMAAHNIDIKSTFIGKLKTNFIGWSFVPWFIHIAGLAPSLEMVWVAIGWTGIAGGLFWSLLSGYDYSMQFFRAYDTLQLDD